MTPLPSPQPFTSLGLGPHRSSGVERLPDQALPSTLPCPMAHRLQDVGPHTWSVLTAGYPLESTPLPFYAQPPSHVAATKGQEPPLRIR